MLYSRKFWQYIGVLFIVAVFAILVIIQVYKKSPPIGVLQFNRQNEPYDIGPIQIGGSMPYGPGEWTFAPYLTIPAGHKFYISVIEPETWCINEDCGLYGAYIQTLGGWLQVESTHQAETKATFGFDLPENQHIKSLVIVGDKKGNTVGIYPNKGSSDVLKILKQHPDLADFNFLNGVDKYGLLQVGDMSPIKPGDNFESIIVSSSPMYVARVPAEKKFYLFSLQKRKYDIVGMYEKYTNEYACVGGGCRYPEPDPPHDFLFAEIDDLGGWFLANDNENIKMIELFGLDPKEVLSGKSSLVVLTDSKGVILDLHPNKTLSDTFTILSKHPELVNLKNTLDDF